MINYYLGSYIDEKTVFFLGVVFAMIVTFLFMLKLKKFLPKDQGRDFAFEGGKSEGKARGAGIYFIFIYAFSVLMFANVEPEMCIYVILVVFAMLTGYFDDASRNPWGEYKKGFFDLVIAVLVAVTFVMYNDTKVTLEIIDFTFKIHPVVMGILIVILVWASINVTNCTDGVDGLLGTLSVITLSGIYIMNNVLKTEENFTYTILIMIAVILAYLWFNATPSTILMGDAGSRAIGLFIAIAMLKTGAPFMYLLVAIVMIVDGGLGLIKVSIIRFLKVQVLSNIRTPIHDHVRKNKDWSNTHTVFRFALIQILACAVAIYFCMI